MGWGGLGWGGVGVVGRVQWRWLVCVNIVWSSTPPPPRHTQVSNMRPGTLYTFHVVSFRKRDSLWQYGLKPLVCSPGSGWSRVTDCGNGVGYYRSPEDEAVGSESPSDGCVLSPSPLLPPSCAVWIHCTLLPFRVPCCPPCSRRYILTFSHVAPIGGSGVAYFASAYP